MRKGLNQDGQAVVEYMLTLVTAIAIASIIGIGFRRSLFRLWTAFAQEIAAPCPECPKDPRYQIR